MHTTAQTALSLLDMLKRLEWAEDSYGYQYCHICGHWLVKGHKSNCELGNLLREVEG